MAHALLLVALIVPLALDTFVVAAALGAAGLPASSRTRVALVLAAFEAGMPILGALAGAAAGSLLGDVAGYVAAAFLAISGGLALRPGGEAAEEHRAALLGRARGAAVIGLGLAVSVDELAAGLGIGLLGLPLLAAVIWIAVQGFAAAQLGVAAGARASEQLREAAERFAGVALIAVAVVVTVLTATGRL